MVDDPFVPIVHVYYQALPVSASQLADKAVDLAGFYLEYYLNNFYHTPSVEADGTLTVHASLVTEYFI